MNETQNPKPKSEKFRIIIFIIIILFAAGLLFTYKNFKATTPAENKETIQDQETQVTLKINTGVNSYEYSEKIKKDATVFDLIKETSTKENFSLEYQNSSMGVFVEGIYGVKNDNQAQKYWTFLVNGDFAEVGASQYKLSEGDVVEWKYGEM